MIQKLLVLGAGSAGLLAALSFKKKIPQLNVRVVRSPQIGVIGVGEGTTPNFPRHIFEYLGISRAEFYQRARPTWKLGIRFHWGPRKRFNYSFSPQLDAQLPGLSLPNGFYCYDDFAFADLPSALMAHDRVFARQPNGAPDVQPWHAFHLENERFVNLLEEMAGQAGIRFIDGKVVSVERGAEGISALKLESGLRLEADFFVDASGFRSELLGGALQEPFVSFERSLFCDRAVIGGWERTSEPILPYTTVETMEAGWAWQIEHERLINRGYVYSSAALSDDAAVEELSRKNPRLSSPRVVRFRSGHYRRHWIDNVVAIGNAGGFVEPLEATSLMAICSEIQDLINLLLHAKLRPTATMRELFNNLMRDSWTDIRDFLALHYKLNTRLTTPFWRHCQEDTDVSSLQPFLEFYRENGPTGFARYTLRSMRNDFGLEGFLVMLLGTRVTHQAKHPIGRDELERWQKHLRQCAALAQNGISVNEALLYVHHPGWRWHGEPPVVTNS